LNLSFPVESSNAEDDLNQSSSSGMPESGGLRSGQNYAAAGSTEAQNLHLTEPFFFDDGTNKNAYLFFKHVIMSYH
jgi:hypothetical protein